VIFRSRWKYVVFGPGHFLMYIGQVEKFQLTKSAKNISIFDDIDYSKMLTLQPHIGLQNGLHRSDACAMTICSMWFDSSNCVGCNCDR